ncbi:unnamed protein product [Plasmodium vivax]|uniref:(malaria parasite P. vivax) hypothetical protein n=1 Tax=Plasmodium vivax TaxID=5855 RepID=A0A8S4HJE9_PLAVI|nr:unnamed protein product [Plasmodium vivax]
MDVRDNPFIKNRSSTRITNAPGGNSTVSFGNYVEPENKNSNRKNANSVSKNNENSEVAGNPEMNKMPSKSDKKTNVKVNQPPGGASSIIFG